MALPAISKQVLKCAIAAEYFIGDSSDADEKIPLLVSSSRAYTSRSDEDSSDTESEASDILEEWQYARMNLEEILDVLKLERSTRPEIRWIEVDELETS